MVTRPLPTLRGEEATYHRYLRQGRFVVQHCGSCDSYIYYPRVICPYCGDSSRLSYRESEGRGTVYTFTVCHRPGHPYFKDAVPYVVAMVELAEGVRIMSNIVDCDPDEVYIGMPVQVVLEPVNDDYGIALFKPVPRGDGGVVTR